ncbi:undecaprenyl-diphosphate phosphatase [Candidatus Uhrbacteria bacterium]|nr:undecaprenyl-diphosphate phosphatase [Candidatus Uhrbacteria bacterium]
MTYLDASILGVIEGVTEFLPISSTGHMILASTFLGIPNTEFLKTFEIVIQLGAILAIVFLYAKHIFHSKHLLQKTLLAFIPTGVIGVVAYAVIKTHLFNPVIVSVALILGGIILILLDKKMSATKESEYQKLEEISYPKALSIGLCQGISVIPGVSRAAATIIGGMASGLSKKEAMEFSFFLAIPTMGMATGYDLYKSSAGITPSDIGLLAWGGIVSFFTAWIAVKLFVKYVERNGFALFGYYRIIIGILFLLFVK